MATMRISERVLLLVIVLVAVLEKGVRADVTCMGTNGSPVDWFVVLKMPGAYTFAYADSNSSSFVLSSKTLDQATGPIAHTLAQIYTGDAAYLMYNDDDGTEHSSFAHAKGVVGFTSNTGFWLVHSTPRFPAPKASGYTFPANEVVYAQSFLCVSMSFDYFDDIGIQLVLDNPYVYDYSIPASLAAQVPHLVQASQNVASKDTFQNRTVIYKSLAGVAFTSFAKSHQAGIELYEDLVAPHFGQDLNVESWIRSPPLPSFCKPTYAYNVINVKSLNVVGNSFNETRDHSKWAISATASPQPIVCVGDINRMSSQAKRGGGTLCFANRDMWASFLSTIVALAPCSQLDEF